MVWKRKQRTIEPGILQSSGSIIYKGHFSFFLSFKCISIERSRSPNPFSFRFNKRRTILFLFLTVYSHCAVFIPWSIKKKKKREFRRPRVISKIEKSACISVRLTIVPSFVVWWLSENYLPSLPVYTERGARCFATIPTPIYAIRITRETCKTEIHTCIHTYYTHTKCVWEINRCVFLNACAGERRKKIACGRYRLFVILIRERLNTGERRKKEIGVYPLRMKWKIMADWKK